MPLTECENGVFLEKVLIRPKWLTDPNARRFWDHHAKLAQEAGTLTPLTLVSFGLLAQTFSDWLAATDARERAKIFDSYFKLATKFGIVPHIAAARATVSKETTVDPGISRLFPGI